MRSRIGVAAERLKHFAFGRATQDGSLRSGEKLGQTDAERPEGFLVWILCDTAAEAGPAPALCHAIGERLEREVTGLVTPLDELPLVSAPQSGIVHQFAPADTEGTIHRFLDHWRPDVVVVIGRPARPRLMAETAARDIPLFYAAGHRDVGSAARRHPGYFDLFERCFTSSASETNLLRQQFPKRSERFETTGPLSDTVFALGCDDAECDSLAQRLGGRPVWLAAEVDGIEINMVETAQRKAFRSAHRLLLILVPRPGAKGKKVARQLEDLGWRVALRSNNQEPDNETQVYIADTEGELGLWYRLAPATFVGGSFQPGEEPGDPFAPAALGSAVLHGPNLGKNPARFAALQANGASLRVANADELGEAVISLLAPDKAASLAQAGWAVTTESAHVVERVAEVVEEVVFAREEAE